MLMLSHLAGDLVSDLGDLLSHLGRSELSHLSPLRCGQKTCFWWGDFASPRGGNTVPPYEKLMSSLPKSAKNKTSSRPPRLGLPSHCPRPRRILRGAPQKIKPLLNSSTAFARQLLLLAFARAAVRPPKQLSYVYIIRRAHCQGGSCQNHQHAPKQQCANAARALCPCNRSECLAASAQ